MAWQSIASSKNGGGRSTDQLDHISYQLQGSLAGGLKRTFAVGDSAQKGSVDVVVAVLRFDLAAVATNGVWSSVATRFETTPIPAFCKCRSTDSRPWKRLVGQPCAIGLKQDFLSSKNVNELSDAFRVVLSTGARGPILT